jgi:hypothetical protein
MVAGAARHLLLGYRKSAMLQPRTYPELLSKALVLEAEPFATMAEDDAPWAEGLFMTVVIGILIAVAQLIGGLLLTASMPPSDALLNLVVQAWRQLSVYFVGLDPAQGEASLRAAWAVIASVSGFGSGWARLAVLVWVPMTLVAQWLIYGLAGHGVARLLGGRGSLNQMLGASALVVAPQAIRLLTVVPFVSVSTALLAVWGVLIVYRAAEVAHDLPWTRAIWVALAPLLLLAAVTALAAWFVATLIVLGGIL